MEDQKRVKLMSSDNQVFEVVEVVAVKFELVKDMMEAGVQDIGIDVPVPLPNVSSKILALVIEYCKYHAEADQKATEGNTEDKPSTPAEDPEEVKAWDKEFLPIDQQTLFDLISAAHYLKVKSLQSLTCQTVADMIKGKTPSEIRHMFHIKNDFTPEEEEAAQREY